MVRDHSVAVFLRPTGSRSGILQTFEVRSRSGVPDRWICCMPVIDSTFYCTQNDAIDEFQSVVIGTKRTKFRNTSLVGVWYVCEAVSSSQMRRNYGRNHSKSLVSSVHEAVSSSQTRRNYVRNHAKILVSSYTKPSRVQAARGLVFDQ